MPRVIAIANQKGGVGKTTTAHNVAASMTYKDYKVLMVDLDPQGNLSFIAGADNAHKPTVYEVLNGKASIKAALQQTKNGDIIPANILLSGADMEITRPELLRNKLEAVKGGYDFVLIDTPPSLGILTINALTAADSVIIPMSADILSLQGISQLYNTIEAVRKRSNPGLKIEGLLFTQHNSRTLLSREFTKATKAVAKRMNTKVFKTAIRASVATREAQANQVDIITYSPISPTSEGYNALTVEIIKGGSKSWLKRK
jgi:chromosome partitioning protein